jgi:hypothetical protein
LFHRARRRRTARSWQPDSGGQRFLAGAVRASDKAVGIANTISAVVPVANLPTINAIDCIGHKAPSFLAIYVSRKSRQHHALIDVRAREALAFL